MGYKLVDETTLNSNLTSIANAIRVKTGGTSSIAFPTGFVSEIEEISSGGNSKENDIIMRTLSGVYENSEVTSIGPYALAYLSLTSVNFPNCTTIDSHAFSATRLGGLSFPKAISINEYAFQYASIDELNFPSVTFVSNYAFAYCSSLKTINLPLLTTIPATMLYGCAGLLNVNIQNASGAVGINAFGNCSSLSIISLPMVSCLSRSAFCSCIGLESAYFSQLRTISDRAFYNCSKLKTIYAPNVYFISDSAFYNCHALSAIVFINNLSSTNEIRNEAFCKCYNLLSLYLLTNSVYYLSSTNAFNSTPIAGYTTSTGGVYGSIFVPASLYDTYISASNWSVYSSRFVSLTDAQISNVLASGTHL